MKAAIRLCALALGLAVPVSAEITVEPLTTASGYGQCADINDAGQAVGDWNYEAFLWSRETGLTSLGLPYSVAYAINDVGEIIGERFIAGNTSMTAFHRSATGELTDVAYPGAHQTRLIDINNAGIVVGTAYSGQYHNSTSRSFLWSRDAGFTDLPADFLLPAAINALGEVVGTLFTPYTAHASIWSASYGLVDLGVLRRESRAFGVNAAGLVVGIADAEVGTRGLGNFAMVGARDRALSLLPLPPDAADTRANDVNEAGSTVGAKWVRQPSPAAGYNGYAALWLPSGEFVDLPRLPGTSQIVAAQARAINNNQQACGWQYVYNAPFGDRALPVLWTLQQTPQQIVTQLQQLVQALRDAGSINGGQANALLVKLNAALAAIEGSDPAAAIARLETFINQVQAFMNAGILTSAEGQPMIDLAQQAIEQLQAQG